MMKKILAILPNSIGGRLTMQSIFDGFQQNGYDIFLFDKLKDDESKLKNICLQEKFDFLRGTGGHEHALARNCR